jgi:hypothetical protein
VPRFRFNNFLTRRGRGCYLPSLLLLVECHLVRLVLVDLYLVSSKERLPNNVDLSIYKTIDFLGGTEVYKHRRRTHYTYIVRVAYLVAVKRPSLITYI